MYLTFRLVARNRISLKIVQALLNKREINLLAYEMPTELEEATWPFVDYHNYQSYH